MKKFCSLLFFAFCIFTSVNAQVINFPDANFKTALLQASVSNNIALNLSGNYFKIDANNDGEIDVNEALNVKELSIGGLSISNIEGINFFSNITYLYCSNNSIAFLDLTGLINLNSLECSGNLLTSFNTSSILANENSLNSLSCGSNLITTLDISNLINLNTLDCSYGSISYLNLSGLVSLTSFRCDNNLLTFLDLSNSVNLTSISCSGNSLSNLILPVTATPISSLNCGANQLTSLNITNIENVTCNSNLIQNITFTHPQSLRYLNAGSNNLTSLDLSHCTRSNIATVGVQNNPNLVSINLKNGVHNVTGVYLPGTPVGLVFYGCPQLQFICVDDIPNELNYVQNRINYFNYASQINVNSYCSFILGGEAYTIQGNSRYDMNNDGCDLTDSNIPNLKFSIVNGTFLRNFTSDRLGEYSTSVQSGTNIVTPVLENPNYFNISPSNLIVDFPTQASPFNQDFCITSNGVHPDLDVILLPTLPARAGFDVNYKLVYKNKGTNVQSGTIGLAFDDLRMDLVSSFPTILTQNTNNLSWNFTNLQPFEIREISVTLNINSQIETPAVNDGDILNYTATVTSSVTDETPIDNTFLLCQTVVNSYDPNDKTCLEGATIAPSEVGKYAHYMIRFENNGTANAQNIVVKDMIDTNKFDISSLVPIKGSHSFVTNISSGNKVEFIFENINLPFDDANNDGYVAFKIKTKPTLVAGNTFSNSANIYFDYNFPIVTNTATTTIQALSAQDFAFGQYFSLYPNPVNNVLNIETKQTIEVGSVSIYNQLGQLVLVIPNAQNTKSVDVSSLSSGNYFIKINSDKGTSNTKFIKK